jgi:hypothetical protein
MALTSGERTTLATVIRTTLGMATNNLDAQLLALSEYVDCLPETWVVPPAASDWTPTRAGYLDAAVSSRSSHTAANVVTALGTGSTLTACATADVSGLATSAELAAVQTHGDSTWATADVSGLSTFDPTTDTVTLANGAHGGAAASLTLADYSDFQGSSSGGDATEAKQDTIIGHLTGIKGTGWSGDTDALTEIRNAVDSIEGASGSGARTVVITVQDTSSNDLENASVRLTEGANTYIATTDSSGEATFNLDDYTYTVAVSKAGYTYSGTTLVVDGDETRTYQMTPLSITEPGDADLCTVQFRVNLSGTPVQGAVCRARLQGTNQATDGTILSNAELSDTTDSLGVADLQLVQAGAITKGSGRYKIWVEISGKPVASVETTIPNESTYLFEDLL